MVHAFPGNGDRSIITKINPPKKLFRPVWRRFKISNLFTALAENCLSPLSPAINLTELFNYWKIGSHLENLIKCLTQPRNCAYFMCSGKVTCCCPYSRRSHPFCGWRAIPNPLGRRWIRSPEMFYHQIVILYIVGDCWTMKESICNEDGGECVKFLFWAKVKRGEAFHCEAYFSLV